MKIIRPALRTSVVGGLLGLWLSNSIASDYSVSAYSLEGWSMQGGLPPPSPSPQALVLPAGGLISRVFPGNTLKLGLKTRATFHSVIEDAPILVVGSCALALLRDGDLGRLALIVGQKSPEVLPFSFKLDNAGRPETSVELELNQSAASLSVSCGGKFVEFPAVAPADGIEVTVVSGASRPWAIDQLSIAVPDMGGVASATVTGRVTPNAAQLRSAFKFLASQSEAPQAATHQSPVPSTALEVFSRPSTGRPTAAASLQ